MGEGRKTRRGKSQGIVKTYLYKDGNEYSALTGGWVAVKEGGSGSSGTLTKNASNLYQNAVALSSWCYLEFFTTNTVDLTNYSKLKCKVTLTTTSTRPNFSLAVRTAKNITSGSLLASAGRITPGTDVILEVDVSSVNSSQYIGLCCEGCSASSPAEQTTATITEVWLEN